MDQYLESFTKKYRQTIYQPLCKAIDEYQLIKENDQIMVCISGGKDSFILALCLKQLSLYSKYHFTCRYVCMDPGYQKVHLDKIKENASLLNLPLEIIPSDIFKANEQNKKNPCFNCARMRRSFLLKTAKNLGCNKIALGHHFDDVIETNLLSIIYGGQIQTMLPKLESQTKGIQIIRPLYLVKEKDIISYKQHFNLNFINCACMLTQKNIDGKRKEIKKLIASLDAIYPLASTNIFNSYENVHLDGILGIIKDGNKEKLI